MLAVLEVQTGARTGLGAIADLVLIRGPPDSNANLKKLLGAKGSRKLQWHPDGILKESTTKTLELFTASNLRILEQKIDLT